MEERAMWTTERMDRRGFRNEELNRARQEIQNKWSEAERSHRRQLAECRQQALARILTLAPVDRAPARQFA